MTHLLVQEADVPRLAALLQDDFAAAVAAEGHAPVLADENACPACGCATTLSDGSCADCGLQLE